MTASGWRKKMPYLALFTALGLILSFIESLIPFYFGIPGMKLGLCNVLVVILLYLDNAHDALAVNVLRIVLAGFLFGNAFSIAYSLAGAFVSFFVMWLLYKSRLFTVATISLMGGMTHNMGQLFVATLLLSQFNLLWYAPVLLAAGAVTGLLIGILAAELLPRLERII